MPDDDVEKRRLELLIEVLKCYPNSYVDGVRPTALKWMCAALEKYSPESIEKAIPIMMRNEEFFSIKKLSDIIYEFELDSSSSEMANQNQVENPNEPHVRAGMDFSAWAAMRDDAICDEDGERGNRVLDRMRDDPESFTESGNPYDEMW